MQPLFIAILLLLSGFQTLGGEGKAWLQVLGNRGYTVFQYHSAYLSLGETHTIPVTLQATGPAIFGAMGGTNALVISMELLGGEELLHHAHTDDLPLIPLSADSAGLVSHMRLTVTDMTHGAMAESVFVYAVVKPVDPGGM